MAAPENDAPRTARVALSILSFVLGFLSLAAIIHFSLPPTLRLHADMRSEKLNILDQWKGGVFAAAFGSSHVNEGFDPRAFDDELTAMQRRTPSVNLGIEGGSQTEQRVMALEFLRHFSASSTHQQPCFLLLELNAGANFTTNHLVHPRAINIYDWDTTRFVLSLSDSSLGRVRRLGRDGYALAAMGLHYANVGMLSSYLLNPPDNQQLLEAETEDGRRGLHVFQQTWVKNAPPQGDASAAVHPVFVDQKLNPGNYDLIDELIADSNNPKLHVTYFVSPFYQDRYRFSLYPETIQTPHGTEPILSIRPDLHPELFQAKYWHDNSHLNEEGAAIASRILADQLQTWYEEHHRKIDCGG